MSATSQIDKNKDNDLTTLATNAVPDDRHISNTFSFGKFWKLAAGFWKGKTGVIAWSLTLINIVIILINIGVQYGINQWNRYFFDSLSAKNIDDVLQAVIYFIGLASIAIAGVMSLVYFRQLLQIHWRRWLTLKLVSSWLNNRRFYQLNIAAPEIDSPEFRMTDDARIATEPVIDFASGLLNAFLTATVFFSVLWQTGGSFKINEYTIPGYFVIAVIVYSLFNSVLMLILGKPLIKYTEAKNAAEAQSRSDLVRIGDNAESIALIGGEDGEKQAINDDLDTVLARWRLVAKHGAFITFLSQGNNVLAPVIPLILGAPKYLSGDMTIGQLMQVAAAFVLVQNALNWIVENYARLAEWAASASRVVQLWETMAEFDVSDKEGQQIVTGQSSDDNLHLRELSVTLSNGKVLINDAEAIIGPGEHVLIKGESGSGKSTLIRAIAGLWQWGNGEVLVPANATVMFIPQKSYIPHGKLRTALAYPNEDDKFSDDILIETLQKCGLRHLKNRLDDEDSWDKKLSGGEQQRFAFCRVLLNKPNIVVLDEATSALDDDGQTAMMNFFGNELKDAMLISVGHRPELEEFHSRTIELTRKLKGAELTDSIDSSEVSHSKLWNRLMRRVFRPRPSPDPAGEKR